MLRKLIFMTTLFIFSACASNTTMTIDGRVSIVGNEPFSYLVITEYKTNKQYKISEEYIPQLNKYQGQNISLKAKIVQKTKNSYPVEIDVISLKEK